LNSTERKKIRFADFHPMHSEIRREIESAIGSVLDSEHYICGPQLLAFEREFADYCGTRHAVGVSNGLDALTLILRALEIGTGDEVILPANTFIATALAVTAVGARPVLVDVDPETFNIDPNQIEKRITRNTRAVIGVHLYGQLCDVKRISEICRSAKIHFIEDAAQAHGAELENKRAGQFGVAAAFSFYPGKNLGAMGDAGAVVTNDPSLADKILLLRGYGSRKKYYHLVKGVNNRLDEMQAAILRVKLKRLDQWNEDRREIARIYSQSFSQATRILIPKNVWEENAHVWHLYVVRCKERDSIQKNLANAGVETLVHYPIPIHLQEAYSDLGYGRGSFEITETLADEILSLPLWVGLDAKESAKAIQNCLGR
jgi:dTDP-4-amino-4,6-dideoxygalactose transaminase